jgi:hypothetical protein
MAILTFDPAIEAVDPPYGARPNQRRVEQSRVLTDGHPHLVARETSRLPGDVERPSVSALEEALSLRPDVLEFMDDRFPEF